MADKLRAEGDLPAEEMKQEKQFGEKGVLIKERLQTAADKAESFRGGDKQGQICTCDI